MWNEEGVVANHAMPLSEEDSLGAVGPGWQYVAVNGASLSSYNSTNKSLLHWSSNHSIDIWVP